MVDDKKVFKAIVIDDESVRNTTYYDVLERKFDVSIINDISSITRKHIMKHDLLVIDICLSKNVSTLTAFRIMHDYELTLPTVIISSEWIKENGEPNEFILQVPSFKNVIKVIGWNEFNKEDNNDRIAEEIYYEFCHYNNIALPSGEDKCVLLHISDPQFGGNTSGLACNDNKRIASFLQKEQIDVDLLVITGDISDKGKKEEFEQAKIWIEELTKSLWDKNPNAQITPREKIIFVPGNHDYDLSANASDNYQFQFNANKIDTFEKRKNVKNYVNQKLGFANFIDFAYNLSDNLVWYKYLNQAFHLNGRFVNWGINIFTLNSVYNISNRNCENRFDQFYCNLSTLNENQIKINTEIREGLCNILVMHNPPTDFRRGTNEGENSWGRLQTLIEDYKIDICLYGHTHDFGEAFRMKGNGGKYCNNLLCVPAPSVRLAAASRTEDASRGFNIIELIKVKGIIKKAKLRYFEMKKASIEEYKVDNEEYDI